MQRQLFPLIAVILIASSTQAQVSNRLNPDFTTTQKEVFESIIGVFNGMYRGDSAMVRSYFDKNAQAYTIFEKNGVTQHKKDDIQRFFDAIGTPHENIWNEYSWNYDIKIDGSLAQVWCDYAFYLNDTFSHCGVDAFQLVKSDGIWKIFVLTDTRKKEGCVIPSFDKIYTPG